VTVLARWPLAVLIGDETAGFLSASEQLYYHDAPVAHVVAYEEGLRAERLQKSVGLVQSQATEFTANPGLEPRVG
jgi:hypothetical protein